MHKQTLEGRGIPISCLVPLKQLTPFARSGRFAAFAADGRAYLWCPKNPGYKLEQEFQAHDCKVLSARRSPDDRHVVTADADGGVKIWHSERFALEGMLNGHIGPVHDLSFSPDGRYLVSCGEDGRQVVWDFQRRSRFGEFPSTSRRDAKEQNWAKQTIFLEGGPPYRVVSCFREGQIVVSRFEPPHAPANDFERTFEPRLRPRVAVLDVRRRSTLAQHQANRISVPLDDLLVACEDGSLARVPLDSPDGPIVHFGAGHKTEPRFLDRYCEFGARVFASIDRDGWLRMWDTYQDASSRTWTGMYNPFFAAEVEKVGDKDAGISGAGFVDDDHIYLDRARNSHELLLLTPNTHGPNAPREEAPPTHFANSRRMGAPLRVGEEIWRKWESGWHCVQGGRFYGGSEREIPFPREAMFGGPRLAVVDRERGSVSLYASDLALVRRISGLRFDSQPTVHQSTDGRWLVVRSGESLRLFQTTPTVEEIALDVARRTPFAISDVAFSPGGEYVSALFGADNSISVWNTANGKRLTTVFGRQRLLAKCAVTSDGRRVLALERETGRIDIWDAARGALLGSFEAGPAGDGIALQFDGRGKQLLVFIRRKNQAYLEAGGDTLRIFRLAE